MPVGRPVEAEARWLYDGSPAGFYCCALESFRTRKIPAEIYPADLAQPSLWPEKEIPTDAGAARRVRAGLRQKLSPRVPELTDNVLYSCMNKKERALLFFLHRAFNDGPDIIFMEGDAQIAPLLKAELHLLRESHLFLGFVRFQDTGSALVAVINPKNFVLPYIAGHFAARYPGENLMIWDKTHGAALLCRHGRREIIRAQGLTLPPITADERYSRDLWKQFYDTVAIAARNNPGCRMTHMPKRFWENMPEMQDQY